AVEYADFLVGQHRKAAAALALLLGTQGWRRFGEQSAERFRERLAEQTKNLPAAERLLRQEEAERLLLLIGQSTPKTTDFDQEEIDRAIDDFNDQQEQLTRRADEADEAADQAAQDDLYLSARAKVAWYDTTAARLRAGGVPLLGGALAVLLLIALAQATRRHVGPVCFISTAATAALLALAWLAPVGTAPHVDREEARVAVLAAPAIQHVRAWDEALA